MTPGTVKKKIRQIGFRARKKSAFGTKVHNRRRRHGRRNISSF